MVFRFVQNSFFLDERNIRTTSLCSRFCVCVLFRRKKSPSLELALAEAVASKVDRHKKGGRKKAGERKMRPLPAKKGTRTHARTHTSELWDDPWNSLRAVFVLFAAFALLLLAIIKTLGARLNSNAIFFLL